MNLRIALRPDGIYVAEASYQGHHVISSGSSRAQVAYRAIALLVLITKPKEEIQAWVARATERGLGFPGTDPGAASRVLS